jgi:hypothetical protein
MGEHSIPQARGEHHHEGIVHTHDHYHVTPNYNDLTTGFDHLSSSHAHEHDHGELTQTRHPHIDFEREHRGEAHVHDHEAPVKLETLEAKTVEQPSATTMRGGKRKTPASRTTA